jgi:hypothetical protein
METTKIKSIDKTDNTWMGQSGMMYDYIVCLEDGTEGTAASPNAEKPPYDVGDEVEYNKTVNNWGTKLKIKKLGGFTPGGGFKDNAETTKRIGASWAIGLAIQQESDPEKILEAAEHFINLRDTLMSKL